MIYRTPVGQGEFLLMIHRTPVGKGWFLFSDSPNTSRSGVISTQWFTEHLQKGTQSWKDLKCCYLTFIVFTENDSSVVQRVAPLPHITPRKGQVLRRYTLWVSLVICCHRFSRLDYTNVYVQSTFSSPSSSFFTVIIIKQNCLYQPYQPANWKHLLTNNHALLTNIHPLGHWFHQTRLKMT